MKAKNIITNAEIEINVRPGASSYEIMQATIRESAIKWQAETEKKKLSYKELLLNTRIFEKYAKKYGLQRELREKGII